MDIMTSPRLRAGINFGNVLLATRDSAGNPRGIAVDLAVELARQLGMALDMVFYEAAGKMADGASRGEWDVAFLAADPDRAHEILFTEPYLEVEATYLVPADSALHAVTDVDRAGVRISVSSKSAYDLYLSRTLKQAELVRAPGPEASVDLYVDQHLEALAGLRPWLREIAARQHGMRVLEGHFYTVKQAVGVSRRREDLFARVAEFMRHAQSSGLLAKKNPLG